MPLYRADPSREPLLTDGEDGELVTFDEDDIRRTVIRRNKKSRRQFICYVVISVILILMFGAGLFLFSGDLSESDSHGKPDFPPSKSVLGKYKNAAVASDNQVCSKIGSDIMKEKHGSTIDATIAVLLCYGVTDPHSSGIGGGHFMTIYDSNKKTSFVIDARETAPAKASQDMFEKDHMTSQEGGLSIAVPGELKGFLKLCELYPCLPWRQLFQPSIDLAKNGFKVSANTANALWTAKDRRKISNNKAMKEAFTNPATGQFYKEGEIAKFPALAKTLEALADEGPQTFYNGSISKHILQDLKDADAIIEKEDLENYNVLKKDSITATFKDGSKLYTPPAPSGGPVLTFIMNIMDGYGITPETVLSEKNELLSYHRLVEAFKFAYALRTDLADPAFDGNVQPVVRNMTSRDYADGVRAKIWDNQTHGFMYYGPTFYDQLKTSTAHLSIVGNDGIAIAVTTTVNLRFGSGVMGSRTGIIFNDEMDDFSSPNITNDFGIKPSPANFIKPGKRPLSSMSPAIVTDKDGGVKMVIGAAGGSHITTTVAYIIMRVLWFGETIKQAIDAARIHHQLLPPYIYYEHNFPQHFVEDLHKLGHNVTDSNFKTDANGVVSQNGWLYANCDVRRGGSPAGF